MGQNRYIYQVYKGNYAASKDRKEQRKMRKWALVKKQDAFQHLGVQYQSQAFYETSDQGTSRGKGWGKGHGDTLKKKKYSNYII